MLPRVESQIRYSRSVARYSDFETQYTSKKFCEKAIFIECVDSLIAKLKEKPIMDGRWKLDRTDE